jgi:hypothetical protein
MEHAAHQAVADAQDPEGAGFPLEGCHGPCSVDGWDLARLPRRRTAEEANTPAELRATSAVGTDAEEALLHKLAGEHPVEFPRSFDAPRQHRDVY